jgi:hypothetical protein
MTASAAQSTKTQSFGQVLRRLLLPYLHTVSEEAALRELVANWHRLTLEVRTAVMDLARRGGITVRATDIFCGRQERLLAFSNDRATGCSISSVSTSRFRREAWRYVRDNPPSRKRRVWRPASGGRSAPARLRRVAGARRREDGGRSPRPHPPGDRFRRAAA